MGTVARDLYIKYGDLELGGTTNQLLHDKFRFNVNADQASLSANFIVTGVTEGAFASACSQAELLGRERWKDLLVKFGSTEFINLSQSANTGLDAEPSIVKVGGDFDTGRSREYRFTVGFGLPASWGTQSGRRQSSVSVSYTPSRRRSVTITGVYTAFGGLDASANYAASISAYATSVLSALGGTYNKIGENIARNETDKTVQFSQQYQEILFNEGDGILDLDAVTVQTRIRHIEKAEFSLVLPNHRHIRQGSYTQMTQFLFDMDYLRWFPGGCLDYLLNRHAQIEKLRHHVYLAFHAAIHTARMQIRTYGLRF